MSGLFSTFNVAKRGISVQQRCIDVTSHNIANANTPGYSRQRADIVTTRPFGMPSMHGAFEPGQLGTGAEVSSISRIRDTFLDYQFRSESSTYGKYEQRYKFLTEVEGIFNEPSDSGISDLMGKFFDAWQEVSKNPSISRNVLVEQSKALSNALNHASNQLDKVSKNAEGLIKDSVFEINNIFNQVNQLNKEIRAVTVSGKTPNDLMDRRDSLLDELSKKFNIDIDREQLNTVTVGSNDSEYGDFTFIQDTDDKDFNRLSYVNSIEDNGDGTYSVTYYELGDSSKPKTINMKMSKDDAKKLGDSRILMADKDGNPVGKDGKPIAEKGEPIIFAPSSGDLKGLASIKDDIQVYRNQLDNLAKALAMAINSVHSGTNKSSEDELPYFVSKEFNEKLKKIKNDSSLDEDEKKKAIKELTKTENENMEKNITSGNLELNCEISDDPMKIKVGKDGAGESDGSKALLIAQIRDAMLLIQNMDKDMTRDKFITLTSEGGIESNTKGMKLDGYFKDTVNKLGVQCQEAKRTTKNQLDLLAGYDESRLSVSGVSLDEEMANLIQFQHAYSANAKVISTVDELLDVVINGLKK